MARIPSPRAGVRDGAIGDKIVVFVETFGFVASSLTWSPCESLEALRKALRATPSRRDDVEEECAYICPSGPETPFL